MRTVIVATAVLFALAGAAHAAEEHSIDTVDPESGTVELDNGITYHTDGSIDTWNSGDTVLVPSSGDRLIDKDQGEGVDATQD